MALKRCPYCRKMFEPDPRTKYKQRVCSGVECQKKRRRETQKKWRAKNPTYFKNDYPRLKEWLNAHPDYLKNYRHNNHDCIAAHNKDNRGPEKSSSSENRAELMEARLIEIERFFRALPCSDIQDVIEAKNPYVKPCCAQFTHG